MRNASIRVKITLWFSVALIIVVGLTYAIVLFAENTVIYKTIKDNLIETVEEKIDEIEYYPYIDDDDEDDCETYIRYGNGYIEIDDSFLKQENKNYTVLYKSDGTLVYGSSPVAMELSDFKFENREVRKLKSGETYWYVYDRKIEEPGLEGLWIRGVTSLEAGAAQFSYVTRMSLIALPILLIIAILGGYHIAKRSLSPFNQIVETAGNIAQGRDLKKRINLGEGDSELHKIAQSFDKMFARLEESFEAEKQFTRDLSHELRTPLAVIGAQCELSLGEDLTLEEHRDALKVIQRQNSKMTNLVEELLTFTRVERKTESYKMDKLDLSRLVSAVCEDMKLVAEKGILLTEDIEPGIYVMGNRDLLTGLLINLINNAYKYGKEDGRIKVSLRKEENRAILEVEDDGIGMAEEDKSKIFNRFYQIDSSRSSEGTGLGLAIAKEIANFHSGELTVESELGKGSTFTLKIEAIR
ncbi:MAG TPA: HAMP domain-containing histidine kinase [Mogibacterium sp.]|nr:HAMP domain-containing histidine kinase [Mogibacterium sp.]